MKRSVLMAVALVAACPLFAKDQAAEDRSAEPYVLHQGGDWPTSWPAELEPYRHHSGPGRFTARFWRSGEDAMHFGIRFATRAEFEAAWPHLLDVRSEGTPIVLRSGRSFWLGGTSHGVCVHQRPAIRFANGLNVPIKPGVRFSETTPLTAAEAKAMTTNSLELFVDGTIVDLDRIKLPKDAEVVDKRVEFEARRVEEGAEPVAEADTAENRDGRALRELERADAVPDRYRTQDPLLSTYEHLSVLVSDPARVEAVKQELAEYGRVIKGPGDLVWGVDVYDDVDTAAARDALAKLDGVSETGTHERAVYDKRIPGLKATLEVGSTSYGIDEADVLELTFVLTNTGREPREFRSVDCSLCEFDLGLEGPGAHSEQIVTLRESALAQAGRVIRLKPGERYELPVTDLTYGDEYWVHRWKWTKPGDYTLTAAYVIGEVRYEAPPLKLKVVDE